MGWSLGVPAAQRIKGRVDAGGTLFVAGDEVGDDSR
jgi:hypothetical protein